MNGPAAIGVFAGVSLYAYVCLFARVSQKQHVQTARH